MITFFQLIANATILVTVLLAFAIIFNYKKLNKSLRLIGIYIIVSASFEIVTASLSRLYQNNLPFLHLYTFFELVFLTYFFNYVFIHLNSRYNIYYISIPASLFLIINVIFIQNINELNTYSSTLTSILTIGFCIHFFILILDFKSTGIKFLTLKIFIYCLFIFHSISSVFMIFGDLLQKLSIEAESLIWSFRGLIMLATKVVLIISFSQLFLKNSKLGNP